MKKTLCKNNLNFVKDVSMIYVNFIIIVITVSEEKRKEALLLYSPLYVSSNITSVGATYFETQTFIQKSARYASIKRIK
jgi:hypothetical protein